MHLVLIRDTAHADATLGTLTLGSLVLQTLELPWVPVDGTLCGHPDTSCVLPGDYVLALHDSKNHPKTFALVNPALGVFHVPADIPSGCIGRSDVLLHNGNWASSSLGCILLGRGRSYVNGRSMVMFSDVALNAFKALVPWIEGHTLSIIDETSMPIQEAA